MNQPLNPCHKCGAPALVESGDSDEMWRIICSREGCTCKPINYRQGSNQSRAAAVRTWNKRRSVAAVEEPCQN